MRAKRSSAGTYPFRAAGQKQGIGFVLWARVFRDVLRAVIAGEAEHEARKKYAQLRKGKQPVIDIEAKSCGEGCRVSALGKEIQSQTDGADAQLFAGERFAGLSGTGTESRKCESTVQ